jgi:predicted CopG family antitoxin
MSVADTITVRVSEETWSRLNRRKGPGDSFDDVISEVLDIAEECDSEDE